MHISSGTQPKRQYIIMYMCTVYMCDQEQWRKVFFFSFFSLQSVVGSSSALKKSISSFDAPMDTLNMVRFVSCARKSDPLESRAIQWRKPSKFMSKVSKWPTEATLTFASSLLFFSGESFYLFVQLIYFFCFPFLLFALSFLFLIIYFFNFAGGSTFTNVKLSPSCITAVPVRSRGCSGRAFFLSKRCACCLDNKI